MKNEELEQMIEKSFRSEPDFCLPADFAKKVTHLVSRREQWKCDLHEYYYLIAVLILLLTIVSVSYYFIDRDILTRCLSFITRNKFSVIFIVIILNFIFFADRVLLRFLFSRSNRT